jgi:hypothetical protein
LPTYARAKRKPSGRGLELVALHLAEVLALDADQLGVAGARRRMQDAFM